MNIGFNAPIRFAGVVLKQENVVSVKASGVPKLTRDLATRRLTRGHKIEAEQSKAFVLLRHPLPKISGRTKDTIQEGLETYAIKALGIVDHDSGDRCAAKAFGEEIKQLENSRSSFPVAVSLVEPHLYVVKTILLENKRNVGPAPIKLRSLRLQPAGCLDLQKGPVGREACHFSASHP